VASVQEAHAAAGDAMLEYNSMDEFSSLTGNLSWFGDWCVNGSSFSSAIPSRGISYY